jgi:hypothetical protein
VVTTIDIVDFEGDQWKIMVPPVRKIRKNKRGQWTMWALCPVRPLELRPYEMVPFPVFTEFWATE